MLPQEPQACATCATPYPSFAGAYHCLTLHTNQPLPYPIKHFHSTLSGISSTLHAHCVSHTLAIRFVQRNTLDPNIRHGVQALPDSTLGVIIWYRISVDHVWTPAFHSIDPTSSCMMCLIIDRSESKFIAVPMNSDCSQSVFIAIMCDHWSCESYESSLAMITDHRCLEFIAIMYD